MLPGGFICGFQGRAQDLMKEGHKEIDISEIELHPPPFGPPKGGGGTIFPN